MAGKITGGDAHKRRLARMHSPQAAELFTRVLYGGAQRIQVAAQILISTGAVSGAKHKASVAPAAPHNDTGVLAGNIEAAVVGTLKAEVTSNAPYAAIHELGGTINHPGGTPYFIRDGKPVFVSKQGQGAHHNLPVTKPHTITMPERPYLRPAAQSERKEIAVMMAKAINKVMRRGG